MNVNWINSDKVILEMEAGQYQRLVTYLALLQVSMKGKKLKKDIPLLDDLHAELYEAMDGRHGAKQKERKEDKSQFRFAEGYYKGRESVLRTNQSGCCCIVNDSDEIISVCGAHEQWGDNLLKRLNEAEDKLEAIEEQFLHFIELRKIKGTG